MSEYVTEAMTDAAVNMLLAEYEQHPEWDDAKDVIENIDIARVIRAALSAAPAQAGGREEIARIVACHLPIPDCPDTVCLPITMTAGDLRALYAALLGPRP